jgi:hypothetical protein
MKVFWAWQYDLPGKISRRFIREALELSIAQINQEQDIEEPDEAFQTGAMFLDHGRKGLKGSPDLAIQILEKINNARVFVGDVTPVGKGLPYTNDEGVHSDGKLLMNPNVAIELGYALKTLTTENVLMVMNSHYGKRSDLPFDLGHKGGPILYNLAPDASKADIEREKKRLVATLRVALLEYVPKPVIEPFAEMKPKIGQGIYFDDGEILVANQNDMDKIKYSMPLRHVMWLRVIPNKKLDMPLSVETLLQTVSRFGGFGTPVSGGLVRQNAYDVACFIPAGNTASIDAISQYSRDGEIWAVNAEILRRGEQGARLYVNSLLMENLFTTSLDLYIQFMQQVSKVPPPIQVEAGIEGIKGRIIAHNGMIVSNTEIMHQDRVTHRGPLKSFAKSDQDAFLLEFFKKV